MMQEAPTTREAMAERKPKKAKKLYMTFVQLLIVLAIVAAMYLSFNSNVLSKPTPVPMKIGQLVRYQFEAEKDAIPQIRHLYGTDIPITKAYVAHYESAGTVLNVWFAEAADEEDVRKLLGDVTARIEAGADATYTNLKKQDVAGLTIYSVAKGEEPQYYYQAGRKFVWLGFEGKSGNASQILADAVQTITGSHDGM